MLTSHVQVEGLLRSPSYRPGGNLEQALSEAFLVLESMMATPEHQLELHNLRQGVLGGTRSGGMFGAESHEMESAGNWVCMYFIHRRGSLLLREPSGPPPQGLGDVGGR